MRILAAVSLATLLAGCSLFTGGQPAAVTRVSGVPFHGQPGFSCGPATIAMALGWTGVQVTPADVAGPFATAARPMSALRDVAERYGRLAYPIHGTSALLAELKAGHPVLYVHNLGVEKEPLWNCGMAVGYDPAADQLLLQAGDQPDKRMSRGLFERLWAEDDDWGLVVLKAGDMPATAEPLPYLKAATRLEQAGLHWEAVMAFDSALSRWPKSDVAFLGLGTSLYRLGDRKGAVDAWKSAAQLASDPAVAKAAIAQAVHDQSD